MSSRNADARPARAPVVAVPAEHEPLSRDVLGDVIRSCAREGRLHCLGRRGERGRHGARVRLSQPGGEVGRPLCQPNRQREAPRSDPACVLGRPGDHVLGADDLGQELRSGRAEHGIERAVDFVREARRGHPGAGVEPEYAAEVERVRLPVTGDRGRALCDLQLAARAEKERARRVEIRRSLAKRRIDRIDPRRRDAERPSVSHSRTTSAAQRRRHSNPERGDKHKTHQWDEALSHADPTSNRLVSRREEMPCRDADVRCDHCKYMFPPLAVGGCRSVRGVIRSSATCEEFKPRQAG